MSNLLGYCPLGRKNCPYIDSYCFDCIKHEKGKCASTSPSEVGRQLGERFGENFERGLKDGSKRGEKE